MTKHTEHYVGAVFENPDNAHAVVEEMIKHS